MLKSKCLSSRYWEFLPESNRLCLEKYSQQYLNQEVHCCCVEVLFGGALTLTAMSFKVIKAISMNQEVHRCCIEILFGGALALIVGCVRCRLRVF